MKVFDALIARGVGDLERQVIAAIPGLGTVRFDAAVPALRWAVEIDVHPWHRSVEGASRDRRRDRLTAAAGWITHRTGEDELRHRFSSVIDELVRSLVQRRSEVGLDVGANR